LRKVRRSTVRPSRLETWRISRRCGAASVDKLADFLVSMMGPSDLGGFVVLEDVFGHVITPGAAHGFRLLRLALRPLGRDGSCGRGTAGTYGEQEIATGKFGSWSFHLHPPFYGMVPIFE